MATYKVVDTSTATDTLPAGMGKLNDNFDYLASTASGEGASMVGTVAAGNLAATNVQVALDELQSDIDNRALTTTLSNYVLTSTLTGSYSTSATYAAPGGAALIGASTGNTVQDDLTTALAAPEGNAVLSSAPSTALAGYVLTADGLDGAAWALPSGGTSSSGAMSASIAIPFGFAGTTSLLPTNSGSVRIHSQADCYIEFGDSGVTTTTASMYFAAGTEIFGIPTSATHIAVRTAGEAGVLNVVGLDTDALQELTTNTMIPVTAGFIATALPIGTKARLFSMTDCYINFGDSTVVADATSMFFEAGTEIMAVGSATHIAAKRYTTDGGLYIAGVN